MMDGLHSPCCADLEQTVTFAEGAVLVGANEMLYTKASYRGASVRNWHNPDYSEATYGRARLEERGAFVVRR